MVDTAVKDKGKEESQEKSPEELKKDEAAAELLKEIDEVEQDQGTDDKSKAEDADAGEDDDQAGESETAEGESESESPESQAGTGQGKRSKGHKRRVGRLVEQRNKERAANQEALAKLKTLEEENKLLKLKAKQLGSAEPELVAPDPNNPKYDLGEDDPAFKADQREFDRETFRKIAREEAQAVSQTTSERQSQQETQRELKRKQESHWDNADKLGVDDYDDKESKAMEILGADMLNNIIDYFDDEGDSAKIVYHLGTNEDVAEEIGELLESRGKGMVKGIAKLGRILEQINAKGIPKKSTPNPDKETQKGDPSPQEALQLRLNALREKASKTGDMSPILEFKRKARKRGIELV